LSRRATTLHAIAPSPTRCVVVEDEAAVRSVLLLGLCGCDVKAPRFSSADEVAALCLAFGPRIVFLDIRTWEFNAADVMRALVAVDFRGAIQLVSGHHGLLDGLRDFGEQNGLAMREPLRKPFRHSEIVQIMREASGQGSAPA
jgi:FixJ family two-component response regulator